MGEIQRQVAGAKTFNTVNGGNHTHISPLAWQLFGRQNLQILNYLGWANMNQGYKNMGSSLGTANGCGTGNCFTTFPSVTLCKKCLTLDQLGNIMYGLVGKAIGFNTGNLIRTTNTVHTVNNLRPTHWEKVAAYYLGAQLVPFINQSLTVFCNHFQSLSGTPNGQYALSGPEGLDLTNCSLCFTRSLSQPSGITKPFTECWPNTNLYASGPNCTGGWEK